MIEDRLAIALERGAKELGVPLTSGVFSKLQHYLALLQKWNQAYNLTAIREPEDMLRLHILDSLTVVPWVQKNRESLQRIIDVGTGAGLPGIVLAVLFGDLPVTLLDSNGKKTRFLIQAKAELSLVNVTVVQERVERYQPEHRYDAIFSRAFATLGDMTDNAQHLLADNGRFLAMKGQYPEAEMSDLASACCIEASYALTIPGVNADRHLIEISMPKGAS